jgi:hypothetical protein
MRNHFPSLGAILSLGLVAETAPWWVPLLVQGISLLIVYLNGRQQSRKPLPLPPAPPPADLSPTSARGLEDLR